MEKEEDIFGGGSSENGVTESNDGECLARESRKMEEKYFNMGFQQGIFEGRQGHIQPGFDVGYQAKAMNAFCEVFLKTCPEDISGTLPTTCIITEETVIRESPQELIDLYEAICILIKSKI